MGSSCLFSHQVCGNLVQPWNGFCTPHMGEDTDTHAHAHTRVRTHTHARMHTHARACTHTYTHTYMEKAQKDLLLVNWRVNPP